MPLFELDNKKDQAFAEMILKKAKKPAQKASATMSGGGTLLSKIKNICSMVQNALGHYQDLLMLIDTEQALHDYITKAIELGEIAIDTETTGLDQYMDHIVGVCLYIPGEKAAYIPMYHVSYITGQRLDNQLDNETVAKELQRIVDAKTKTIFFNAKFDIEMMRHSLGVYMEPYWDGFIAGKCLKENEEESSLKYLWKKYCSENKDAPHFTFDKFFKGLKFDLVPITTAYLYAAMDPKMTYELYKFQEPYLTETDEKCIGLNMQKLAKLYREIEMPIITVVADIEDRGVALDTEFAKELSVEYHKILDEQLAKIYTELNNYKEQIDSYLTTHPDTKLSNPINIGSPVQLAELFYDILKVTPPDKRNPRGTGEDILKAMKHPLCELILDYRGTQKLLSTYIDKLPEVLNKKTGRIHAGFHQYGADCIIGSTIISTLEGNKTIESLCKDVIEEDDVFYPLQIYIINRYSEVEKTSHCIRFTDVETIEIIFDDNSNIEGTPNHPVLDSSDEWIKLEDIKIGTRIKGTNDRILTVIDINHKRNTVYDFKVPGTHSFQSNNVISHNTGRFASSNPNLQNIPSHIKSIRKLFISSRVYETESIDNKFDLLFGDVIKTSQGKIFVQDLQPGMNIICEDGTYTVKNIEINDMQVKVFI